MVWLIIKFAHGTKLGGESISLGPGLLFKVMSIVWRNGPIGNV